MSALLVYAVVDEEPADPGPGLAGEPLRLVALEGALRAVVGDVEAGPAVEPAHLRAHDATLRRLAARVPAILPARFGTLAASSDALVRRLAPCRAALEAALALVRGREQLTLRVYADAPPPVDEPGLGPGARYLAARARAGRVPELGALREALLPLVRGERVERHAAPPLVASVYHLVNAGASGAYLAALAATPAPDGVKVRASGPWPPYAFVPEALP